MPPPDSDTPIQPRWLDWFYIPFSGVFIGMGLLLTFFPIYSDPDHPRFLMLGDAWVENGPKLFYGDAALDQGEFALWNSLTFCGQPAAANPQYMVFYPPNILRSQLTPGEPTPFKTHVGINLMIGAHMLLGGFAAYLFARGHRLSGAASVVTAFAFVFSAPMVSRAIGHWQFVVMVAWLPLNLLLLHLGMTAKTTRGALRAYLLLGLVFGTTLLGGSPHFMLLCGLTLAGYWALSRLADLGEAWRDTDRSAAWRNTGRNAIRDAGLGAIALAIALAFAAPMLLPAAEFSQFSSRLDSDGTNEVELIAQGDDSWNIFERLVVYTGTENYEGIRAAGAGVTMLALLAVAFGRRRLAFVFGALFLILLDCSLDSPLFFGKIVSALSPYKMSSPGRAMLVACIPLGMLAGTAIDGMLTGARTTRLRIIGTGSAIVVAVAVLGTATRLVTPHPFLDVSLLVVLIPASLVGVLVLGVWVREPIIFGAMIAMLVLGESLAWNLNYIAYSTRPGLIYEGDMEALKKPAAFRPWNHRTAHAQPNLNVYELDPVINGHDPLHMRAVRDVLCRSFEGDTYRRNIKPVEALGLNARGNQFLKRAFWLTRQAVEGPLPEMDALFPPTTTTFLPEAPNSLVVPLVDEAQVVGDAVSENVIEAVIVSPDGPPEIVRSDATEESEKGMYFGTTEPLPPLHTTLTLGVNSSTPLEIIPGFRDQRSGRRYYGRIRTTPAMAARTQFVYDIPLPDIRDVELGVVPKFVEGAGEFVVHEARVRSDRSDEGRRIRVDSRTANTVEVTVDAIEGPRLLTFIDSYYPGWTATLDGEAIPIHKANDVFKAVEVPEGTHTVRFEFNPWRVRVGLWAAGIAVALVVAGTLVATFQGRRRE